MAFGHDRLHVVTNYGFGHPAQPAFAIGDGTDQILPLLAGGRLHVGVLAAWQNGDKDLGWPDLAGIAIYPTKSLAGKVHEQLLAGLVAQDTTGLCFSLPLVKMMNKLRVAIPVGMISQIASP